MHIILLNCSKKNVGLMDAVQILIVIDTILNLDIAVDAVIYYLKIVDVISNYYFNNFF